MFLPFLYFINIIYFLYNINMSLNSVIVNILSLGCLEVKSRCTFQQQLNTCL